MATLPTLYDMDLERMHVDLYRGKYLTIQDILEDIHKIVENAATRQHEDLDRLYKAQAMLTAAEVSMHDFDPQLRLECKRATTPRGEEEGQREGQGVRRRWTEWSHVCTSYSQKRPTKQTTIAIEDH